MGDAIEARCLAIGEVKYGVADFWWFDHFGQVGFVIRTYCWTEVVEDIKEGSSVICRWEAGEVLVLNVVVVVAGKFSHIRRAFGVGWGVGVGDA